MADPQPQNGESKERFPRFVHERWLVLSIVILAIAVRAIGISHTDPVALDSAVYFEMAQFVRAGAWETVLAYPYPPLFPLLIAGLEKLGISTEVAGLLLSCGLNLGVLFPLFFITRKLAGRQAALGATLLWAIHPYAVRLSIRALSDSPTVFLVAMSLWLGLWSHRNKTRFFAFVAGILSGLAYLSRPEGMEAAIGLAFLYALQPEPSTNSSVEPTRRVSARILWALMPLMGWALVASPYVAHLSIQEGALTLSKKKSVQAMLGSLAGPAPEQENSPSNTGEETSAVQPQPTERLAVPRAPERPGWLRRTARNIYIFQQPLHNGVYPVVLFLAIWGVIAFRSGKISTERPVLILLTNLAGLHFLIVLGVAVQSGADYLGGHHFFLLVLYLLPFAGAGLAAAVMEVRARFPQVSWAPAAVVALVLLLVIPASLRRRDDRGQSLRLAGLWVRQHLPREGSVVAKSRKFAFHASAQRIPLQGDYKAVIDQARKQGVRFVGSDSENPQAREIEALIRSGDLELAAEFSEGSGKRLYTYRVYRILPGH